MIIDLSTYRRTRRIVERIPIVYDDARLELARRVEQGLYEMEAAMAGRPCDSEEPGAA